MTEKELQELRKLREELRSSIIYSDGVEKSVSKEKEEKKADNDIKVFIKKIQSI